MYPVHLLSKSMVSSTFGVWSQSDWVYYCYVYYGSILGDAVSYGKVIRLQVNHLRTERSPRHNNRAGDGRSNEDKLACELEKIKCQDLRLRRSISQYIGENIIIWTITSIKKMIISTLTQLKCNYQTKKMLFYGHCWSVFFDFLPWGRVPLTINLYPIWHSWAEITFTICPWSQCVLMTRIITCLVTKKWMGCLCKSYVLCVPFYFAVAWKSSKLWESRFVSFAQTSADALMIAGGAITLSL